MRRHLIILAFFLSGCSISPEEEKLIGEFKTIYGGSVYLKKGKSTEDLNKDYCGIEIENSPIVNDTNNQPRLIAGNCALKHFEILSKEEKEKYLETTITLKRDNRKFEYVYKKDQLDKLSASREFTRLFFIHLKSKEFEKAYSLFSPDIKEKIPFENFSDTFAGIINSIKGIQEILITGVAKVETMDNRTLYYTETIIVGASDRTFFNCFIDAGKECQILKLSNKKSSL